MQSLKKIHAWAQMQVPLWDGSLYIQRGYRSQGSPSSNLKCISFPEDHFCSYKIV